MVTLRPSAPQDVNRTVEIWCHAVDATHHFLRPEDRIALELKVRTFFATAPLTLAVDEHDHPLGFMLVQDGNMDALFIDPKHHRKGIGQALVAEALRQTPNLTTDVNEQNRSAAAFYERLGFVPTGRSELDGQGRPYPLIHLRYEGPPIAPPQ